jgi:ubiquitin C-terminal hydrolase
VSNRRDGSLCDVSHSLVYLLFASASVHRFHATSRTIEKSSKDVDFPLCFNLADFMTPPIDSALVKPFSEADVNMHKPKDAFYHLFGIVSHGGGMGSGHYVACCRKQNMEAACATDDRPSSHSSTACQLDAQDLTRGWYYFSDSDVRPVSVSEVLKVQAYLLFYVKV